MWWNGSLCSDGGTIVKLKASNIHMQLKIHMSFGCVEIGSNISHRLFEMNHIRIVWIIQKTRNLVISPFPGDAKEIQRRQNQFLQLNRGHFAVVWLLLLLLWITCLSIFFHIFIGFFSLLLFLLSFFPVSQFFSQPPHHSTVHKSIFSICFYSNIFLLYSISVRKSSTDYLNNLFAMLVRSKCKRNFAMNKIQFDDWEMYGCYGCFRCTLTCFCANNEVLFDQIQSELKAEKMSSR